MNPLHFGNIRNISNASVSDKAYRPSRDGIKRIRMPINNLIATYGQATVNQALNNLISQFLSNGIGSLITSPRYLPVSVDRRENLLALFGQHSNSDSTVSVRDNDRDGKISAGDTVTVRTRSKIRVKGLHLTQPRDSIQSRTLTTDDVATPMAKLLSRNITENYSLHSIPGLLLPSTKRFGSRADIQILDKNGDGKISVGDRAVGRSRNGYGPMVVRKEKTLTAQDVGGLKLSHLVTSKYDLRSLFNIQLAPAGSTVSVYDRDGSGKISAGDTVVLSGGTRGGTISKKTLIQADLDKGLPLSSGVTNNYALLSFFEHNLRIKRPQEAIPQVKVLDKNGDGKISAGDTLVSTVKGREISTKTLSDADIARGLPLSYARTEKYDLDSLFFSKPASIFDFSRPPSWVMVLDKNGDGRISEGDTAVLYSRYNGQEIGSKDITTKDLNRIAIHKVGKGPIRQSWGLISKFSGVFERAQNNTQSRIDLPVRKSVGEFFSKISLAIKNAQINNHQNQSNIK